MGSKAGDSKKKKVYNMKLWEKTKRQLEEKKKGVDSAGRSTKIHPAKND